MDTFNKTNISEYFNETGESEAKQCSYSCVAVAAGEFLLAAAIFFGNGLVITSVIKFRKLHNLNNMLIVNLAVSDFLLGLSALYTVFVKYMFSSLGIMIWYTSSSQCVTWIALQLVSSGVSLFTLLAIAAERYTAVMAPFWYKEHVTRQTMIIIIIVVWILGLIIGMVLPAAADNSWWMGDNCKFLNAMNNGYLIPVIISSLLFGLIITGSLYTRVFLEARRHKRQVEAMIRSVSTNDNSISQSKNYKLVIMSTLVLGTFYACWLPMLVLLIAFAAMNKTNSNVEYASYWDILHIVCALLIGSSSLSNPVIYSWHNRTFNAAFKQLLCCRRQKDSSNNNATDLITKNTN